MDLDALLQQPEAHRDERWEKEFLKAIPSTKVELVQEQPQPGPDGWPYLLARTGAAGSEPFIRIVDWTRTRGVGVALNTHKMVPDYVFTYGMLWNYAQTGQFIHPATPPTAGEVEIQPGQRMLAGEPSEAYLPGYVRQVLREFLRAQGYEKPRIVVMSTADFKNTDLVFSVESLNDLKPNDHRTFAAAVSWFLPLHYSLILGSERNLRGFVDL